MLSNVLQVYLDNNAFNLSEGLAFNLFKWNKWKEGFMHDEHSYTTMKGKLGRARKFEVINLLLVEMRRTGMNQLL